MSREYVFLKWILMLDGLVLICAFVAVFLPVSVMQSVHSWLGLGEFPDIPITVYLARSTSLLYGIHGSLMFYTGLTIRQHWRYVPIFGWMHVLIGSTLLVTDLLAEMPTYWTLGEGVPIAALGVLILVLVKRGTISESESS